MTEPGRVEGAQAPAEHHILSQGQGDAFDRRVEFVSVLVLSVATVLTAWCAYQAALFDGDFMEGSIASSNTRVVASQLRTQAMVERSLQASLFTSYAEAIAREETELADFLYQRFPPELRKATDDWLALAPLESPDAPATPFHMPSYVLALDQEASEVEAQAEAEMADAKAQDETSDHYVLLTVIFATVLFFSGIAGKFQWRVIDAAMLGIGIVVLFGGLAVLLSSPIQ